LTKISEPFHYQMYQKPIRTQRIDKLYEYVGASKVGMCMERGRIITQVYQKNRHLPPILLRATALNEILNQMSLYILPGSLLAGNQGSKPNYAPLFPEFTVDFLEEEFIKGNPYFPDERPADCIEYQRENVTELQEIISYWKGNTHKDRLYANLPPEAISAQDDVGAVNIVNFMHGGCGHLTPPWPWLFSNGLQRIIEICDEKRSELKQWTVDGIEKNRFYTAAAMVCQSLIDFSQRYALLAEKQIEQTESKQRKDELKELARICRKVPKYPAESFHEAIQFMTIVQFGIQIENNAQGISPGRFDFVMNPFYQRDLEQGVLTRDRAMELIQNFFILLSTIERMRSWDDTAYFRGKPIFQNLTTGGIDPLTGEDATNDISYMILDCIANTRTLQPSHYVRWHKKTPEKFKLKIAETIRLGTGFPAIANDDLYTPAMMNRGYSKEDASDYCIVGCAEPGVAGKRGGRTGAAWFCIAKIMELSLYGGFDPRSKVTLHRNKNNKDLESFASFDEVWEAFIDQMQYYAKIHAIMDNVTDYLWEEYMEEPLTSILGCTETCLERGKSIKKGGAKYDFTGNETIGTANTGNSLYAVKRLVFDDKLLTGAQLKHALLTNFEDITTKPTGPQIQQMCLNVPKYGNDIEEVDELVAKVLEAVCEELPKYQNTRFGRGPIGGIFQASTTTVSSNTPFGMITGALPDGRQKGISLADGQSPMRGTDTKGPTATVKSVARCNNLILSEGSLFNMKLLPQDLR
jgi:pyruvate formate-lyase/glycerol dehydratase family glycyl radical enzyme